MTKRFGTHHESLLNRKQGKDENVMASDLISVIIPVFNTSLFLRKCIDSFINQTYETLEIILIDDGSTDGSSAICDEYAQKDARVVVVHKENEGLSRARNLGIEVAKGECITFFDSDDYVESDYIEYLYKLKMKYKCQLSMCAYGVVNENGRLLSEMKVSKEEVLTKEATLEKMLYEKGISVSACFKLYDRSLFSDIVFPEGKICEDNGTTYKVIDKVDGLIACGCEIKAYYVMRNNSIMRGVFNFKKLDMIELTDEMCDYLMVHYSSLQEAINRRRIYARFNILRQLEYDDETTLELRKNLTEYIVSNRKQIFTPNTPRRDKIACLLLCVNDRLFFVGWKLYGIIKKK